VDAVLTADRVDCGQSVPPLQLGDVGSSGVVHLSSSLVSSSQTSDTGCGSDAAPWLISARPGQRIRVTLLDFDVTVQPSSSLNDTETPVCTSTTWGQTVYAIINDATSSADNVTVCGGWSPRGAEVQASARSRVVYETVGHVVEIRMPVIGRQQAVPRQRRTSFVLRVSGK